MNTSVNTPCTKEAIIIFLNRMLVIAVFNRQITNEILNVQALQHLCVFLLLGSFMFQPKPFFNVPACVGNNRVCLPNTGKVGSRLTPQVIRLL